MLAMRCKDCGDVRWSFSSRGVSHEGDRCELCGGEMVRERRIPGHARTGSTDERRHEPQPRA